MNLYIRQHVFTWGDRFSVTDENGNDCYYVEGEVFTWGKKLHLYDCTGREIIFIQQKLLSFLPKYYISKNGFQSAEVIKEFTFLHQEYTVNGPGWTVSGDFFAHEYAIRDSVRQIAQISKRWFTWGDTYEISIADGADVSMVLSVVLVIDACVDAENNNC